MKVVSLLLVLLNFSWALPPLRRYGYDQTDTGYHKPLALDTRLGGRYADVSRPSQGDHAKWCPLLARDALRSTVQRLPATSRSEGPSFFHNQLDDNDAVPRHGRSYQTDSNARQTNDLNEVDSSDLNQDGVNVGGVFWPRRHNQKLDVENSKPDCGCHHDKIATLAKDATAAAANAATAAALAARAAARAAAAAACRPEDTPEDQSRDENSSDLFSTARSDRRRLGYSTNDYENDYHDDKEVFGDEEDTVNSQDTDDNVLPQQKARGVESSEGLTDKDDFSQSNTRSAIDSLRNKNTGEGTNSMDNVDEKRPTGSQFSQGNTIRDMSPRKSNGGGMNSQVIGNNGKLSEELSLESNGSEITNRKTNGANSQGLTYNGNYPQGIPYPKHPVAGVKTYNTAINGEHFQGTTNVGKYTQGRTDTVNSQGSNSNGVLSKELKSKVANSQPLSVSHKNSVDNKIFRSVDGHADELKKNLTSAGVSNVQTISPQVVRKDS